MSTRRLTMLAALASMLVLGAVLAGCSSGSSTPVNPPSTTPVGASTTTTPTTTTSAHTVVTIKDFSFTPATVTVKVGTQVVWQNNGKVKHAVAFDDGSAKSPDIAPGDVAAHTFTKAGTYRYHAPDHPEMTGTVIVK